MLHKPSVTINHLQHTGIPVSDMNASRSFYESLGFSSVMEKKFDMDADQGLCVMMRLNDILLELYQLPTAYMAGIKDRHDGHIDHIAFDVRDIDTVYLEIKKAGYRVIEPAPVFLPFWDKGCRYFNITGPDGERLEFNEIL